MTAPVIGFGGEVGSHDRGNYSFIEVTPIQVTILDYPDDDGERILVTVGDGETDRERMLVSHDEARQIIAGLASVIT